MSLDLRLISTYHTISRSSVRPRVARELTAVSEIPTLLAISLSV